jgi:uncharacterized membrane protein
MLVAVAAEQTVMHQQERLAQVVLGVVVMVRTAAQRLVRELQTLVVVVVVAGFKMVV